MRRYAQLTQEQRYQIYAGKKAGFNQTEMAAMIGVHKPTVSREFVRNTGMKGYRASQAHRLALGRRNGRSWKRISGADWESIDHLLEAGLEPRANHWQVGNGKRHQRQPRVDLPSHLS